MYFSAGSAEVGAHLVAGGLDAVDPLVAGHGAGDEAVHGIEEHLTDGAEAGDGLVGGEGAQGSLGAGVVDAVEDLVVAAELVDNAGDGLHGSALGEDVNSGVAVQEGDELLGGLDVLSAGRDPGLLKDCLLYTSPSPRD